MPALKTISDLLSPPPSPGPDMHVEDFARAALSALLKSGFVGIGLAAIQAYLVPAASAVNPLLGAALTLAITGATTLLRIYTSDTPAAQALR